MKRIVFIITDFGSFNNFLSELAVKLARNGYEISVISSTQKIINVDDKYDYKKENIDIYSINFPRDFNIFNHYNISKKIHAILDHINPDLVSIHFTTGIFTTVLSSKLKFYSIGTFHGLGYPVVRGLKRFIFQIVEFFSASKLDEIWLLNQSDYNIFKKKYINTFLLPTKGLGCNLDVFNPSLFSQESKNKLKNDLGITDDDFVITYTGRFVHFKGYDIVIKTFRLLEKKYSNLKLLTLGGPDNAHETGLNSEEEEYIKNNKNIINIGFTNKVSNYLSITNLFFFPSKKEGIPVCIIESLAMEIPVVTYDARGCNDLIINGYNGKLLSLVKKEQEFALEIEEVLMNKKLITEYIENIKRDRNLYSRNNFIDFQMKHLILLAEKACNS